MIEIKHVKKAFDSHVLFEELNVTIESGDFVVFSGPSGCGKTTLLNMIGALEPFDEGKILVDGIDIRKKKNQLSYFSEKVGFLFQNFALMEEKTVRENLEIIKAKNRTKVSLEDALRCVKLLDKIDQYVYTLSGGEQQRVAMARLLLKKCDVILADEPTGSLDQKNAETVVSILKILNKMGKTIILVTHDENIKKQGKRIIEI